MMNGRTPRICCCLALVGMAAAGCSASKSSGALGNKLFSVTPTETLSVTDEGFSASRNNAGNGEWMSGIVTYNGAIYVGYVTSGLEAYVAKKVPAGGSWQSTLLEPNVNADDWHQGVSLGIDRDGYVHAAYNMHHSPYDKPGNSGPAWQYKVSDKPEDISSFTFVGGTSRSIPGTWITYPGFHRDHNGELYVTFRHRVDDGGWTPGDLAAAIAKYDPDNQTWTMLGGDSYAHGSTPFTYHDTVSEPTTWFWNNSGHDGTAYQGYTPDIFFDAKNRMHVVVECDDGVTTQQTNGGTHVVYAYSDDGGKTFHKADGSQYSSLPITLSSADVVVGPSFTSGYGVRMGRDVIGTDTAGNPVIAFGREGEKTYLVRWTGTSWTSPQATPSGSHFPRMITDQCGTITLVDSNKLLRSADDGGSWQSYTATTAGSYSTKLDRLYVRATSDIRYLNYSSTLSIKTADFTGIPCTPPPPADARSDGSDSASLEPDAASAGTDGGTQPTTDSSPSPPADGAAGLTGDSGCSCGAVQARAGRACVWLLVLFVAGVIAVSRRPGRSPFPREGGTPRSS